jgi:hypothetical protein
MSPQERYVRLARRMGCPLDQARNFLAAEIVLQERRLGTAELAAGVKVTGFWRRWGRMIFSGCQG